MGVNKHIFNMKTQYFPMFIHAFYSESKLRKQPEQILVEVGEAFDAYLKTKVRDVIYNNITDITPSTIITRMGNPLFEDTKGYHPALLLHFDEFIKSNSTVNPNHYVANGRECIVEMYENFGHLAVLNFCELNAYKYNYRQDHKQQKDEDLAKAKWYTIVAEQLKQGKGINEALQIVRGGGSHE